MNQKTTLSDSELLRAYIEQNDSQALSLFFNHLSDKFFRIAYSYLHNEADVDDVLQTTFITIMEKAKNISPENIANEAVIRAWCIKIVMNTCRLKLRESKNRTKRETVIGSQRMQIGENDNIETKNEIDPKLSKELDNALKILPEKYRLPIHLRYVEKMDYDEISNILMEKPSTIRVQLKRGLEKLGIILKEKGVVTTGLLLTTILSAKSLKAAPSGTSAIFHKVVFEKKSSNLPKNNLTSTPSFFLSKTFLLIGVLFISMVGIYYFQQKSKSLILEPKQELSQKTEKAKNSYTNDFWDFSKEKVLNFVNYHDSLIWENIRKGHAGQEDQIAIFGLNIEAQDKPFRLNSLLSVNTKIAKTGAIYRFLWANGDVLLKHKLYQLYIYELDWDQKISRDTYVYKNYIINMFGNKINEILEFEEIPKDARIICGSLNFLISNIQSTTIEEKDISKNILDAIQSIKNKKPNMICPDQNFLGPNSKLKF